MEITNVSFSIKDIRNRDKKNLEDRDKHANKGLGGPYLPLEGESNLGIYPNVNNSLGEIK